MKQVKLMPFSTRLKNILADRKMSQSDLARRMFPGEERIDERGYSSPFGKDSISKWVNGKATPDAVNIQRLCEALNMSVEELAPDLLSKETKNEPKEFEMTVLAGRPGVARVLVDTILPMDVAVRIMSEIAAARVED